MNPAKLFLWIMFMAVPCFVRFVSLGLKARDFGGWMESEGIVIAIVTGLIAGGILCAL